MAKRPLEIDMCATSQLRDTQGEMLNLEGADISDLDRGVGRLNDNHGKGFFNCLGKVITAKKIFKAEDCENDRQRYYWEKVKSPYLYVSGQLFDDEDHPNAKAAAAILRNIHKTDCPLKIKASVEGGVISRGVSDPALLARTKIHSIALTFVPANQATLVEPLNLTKSEVDVAADMILIKSVLHLAQTNVPSFRHITRAASAEKIEQNINKIMTALGKEVPADLKQALIKASLERRIADNVEKINSLVKMELLQKGKKELLAMYKPEHLESGKQHVEWANNTLPKSNWKEWAVKNHATNPNGFTNEHKTAITHFASLDHPLVRDVPLSAKVSLEDGLQKLKVGEETYKEKVGQKVNLVDPDGAQKISHFGFNKGWFDLKTPYCEKEAKAMGHCGNVEGQERATDNILSYRDIKSNGKHEPHLTFIENNGWLGETKATANTKPSSKYHEAIVQLLKNPRIKGIAGGGYEAKNNFTFEDLDPKLQKEVMDANPNFTPNIQTPDNVDKALANNLPSHHKQTLIENAHGPLTPKHHEQLVNDPHYGVRQAIARHPNLDPKHHEQLVNDEDAAVRVAMAQHPNLDPKHHEQLVNDTDAGVRQAIAQHPNLDLKHHGQLVNDPHNNVRAGAAQNPNLDPRHHEQLVNDPSTNVRQVIAQHPNLDLKHHGQLVNDPHNNVRAGAAQNPNLDPKLHEQLVNDPNIGARHAMAYRKDLDPKLHEQLVNDPNIGVRQAIAQHPNLDLKHHGQLINDPDYGVRYTMALHPNLDPKLHAQLVNDPYNNVREAIAQNPNLDPKHHGQLINDPSARVREAIAQHPNLDPKLHAQLLNDEDEYVRQAAAQNPKFLNKALIAGYGGAGTPTGMTGGGVLQGESQELGPKGFSFITCDACGKEQIYGKYQVKCREPECGKAFSMAKLEKFFSLQKSKKNSSEEQAKIDDFMNRKAKGPPTHQTMGTGTKGHLPPALAGTFHGQGTTTSGKIVNKRFMYQNKETGEDRFRSVPQQEQHHWAWDHNNKKWNHIRTSFGSPNRG